MLLSLVGTESNIRCPDPQEALKDYVQLPISNTPVKKGGLPHSMLILILDELDSLRSQDCSILYSLFGLPQVQNLYSAIRKHLLIGKLPQSLELLCLISLYKWQKLFIDSAAFKELFPSC